MGKTYHSIFIHIVFSTKGRLPLITKEIETELYSFTSRVAGDIGSKMIAIGGVENHVHCLISLPPSKSLSQVVKILKGSSSRWINDKHQDKNFSWQQGFSAFSVSRQVVSSVVKYIHNQKAHHSQCSYDQELKMFEK